MRKPVHSALFAVIMIVAVLLGGCSGNPPESGLNEIELLQNGSLESGGADTGPDFWAWDPAGQTIAWSGTYYRSGAKSVGCDDVVDSDSFAFWAQTVWPVPTGVKVKLTAWVRMSNLAGNGAAIAIRGDDTETPDIDAESFTTTESKIFISGTTTGWVRYTLVSDAIPAGIKSLTVYLLILSHTTGMVYFDDVSLTYLSESGPTETELLADGSMESGDTSPDCWWQNTDAQTLTWSTDYYRSGARSLGCDDVIDSDSFAFWAQTVTPVPTGVRTILTVWVRMNNLSGGGAAIMIRGDDAEAPDDNAEFGTSTESKVFISGTTTDWVQYTLESEPIPTGIKSLTVYLLILPHTTGTIYFDDASLKSISLPL